jgi:hypothetical protein
VWGGWSPLSIIHYSNQVQRGSKNSRESKKNSQRVGKLNTTESRKSKVCFEIFPQEPTFVAILKLLRAQRPYTHDDLNGLSSFLWTHEEPGLWAKLSLSLFWSKEKTNQVSWMSINPSDFPKYPDYAYAPPR